AGRVCRRPEDFVELFLRIFSVWRHSYFVRLLNVALIMFWRICFFLSRIFCCSSMLRLRFTRDRCFESGSLGIFIFSSSRRGTAPIYEPVTMFATADWPSRELRKSEIYSGNTSDEV